MKPLTYYQLAMELDAAIKRLGNDLQTACLYRSYAGAVLLSMAKDKLYPVNIGSLTITKGDIRLQLGPKGAYSIDEEPQRALDNGNFHVWIVRRSPLGVIDLSARYFAQYDKTGALGKLTNLPTVLSINGASIQLDDLEIGYLSSEPATILADEQFLQNGMPDPLWRVTREVGKEFGIRVPLSYKRKSG